jgi:hypothetical protein
MSESALRALVRQAIQSKRLAHPDPDQTTGRPGGGAPCAICDEVMAPDQVEIRARLIGGHTLGVHTRCFRVWQSEGAAHLDSRLS